VEAEGGGSGAGLQPDNSNAKHVKYANEQSLFINDFPCLQLQSDGSVHQGRRDIR